MMMLLLLLLMMMIEQTEMSTFNSSKVTFEAKLILTADIYPTG
jgi:hypothetical protein